MIYLITNHLHNFYSSSKSNTSFLMTSPVIEQENIPPMDGINTSVMEPVSEKKPAAKGRKTSKVKEVKAKKPAAAAKKKSVSTHPSYEEMIKDAIVTLKERTGSSQYAIQKFIEEKHKVLSPSFRKMLLLNLKRLVASKKLVKVKASFKIPSGSSPKPSATEKKKPATTAVSKSKGKVTAASKSKVTKKSAAVKPKSVAAKLTAKAKATVAPKRKAVAPKPKAKARPAKAAKTTTVTSPGKKAAVAAKKKAPAVVTKKKTPVKKIVKPKSVKSPVKRTSRRVTK